MLGSTSESNRSIVHRLWMFLKISSRMLSMAQNPYCRMTCGALRSPAWGSCSAARPSSALALSRCSPNRILPHAPLPPRPLGPSCSCVALCSARDPPGCLQLQPACALRRNPCCWYRLRGHRDEGSRRTSLKPIGPAIPARCHCQHAESCILLEFRLIVVDWLGSCMTG